MKWDELTDEVGKRVYVIEMAEGFVPAHEADARWERFKVTRKQSHIGNEMDAIHRYVGSALIALEEMNLIQFDK